MTTTWHGVATASWDATGRTDGAFSLIKQGQKAPNPHCCNPNPSLSVTFLLFFLFFFSLLSPKGLQDQLDREIYDIPLD